MSQRRYGSLPSRISRQPGSELVYRSDGLIEGNIAYDLDLDTSIAAVKGMIGSPHPDDPTVLLYAGRLVHRKLRIGTMTFDCLGLAKDPTDRVVQGQPQISTTAVEAHPKFTSTLAGTADAPLNGAVFDDEHTFDHFGAGPLIGTSSFYDGGLTIRSTYYTRRSPTLDRAFTLTTALPNIPHIPGVDQWLIFPSGFEEIPNTGIFKVSEELVGVGPGGKASATLLYGN